MIETIIEFFNYDIPMSETTAWIIRIGCLSFCVVCGLIVVYYELKNS